MEAHFGPITESYAGPLDSLLVVSRDIESINII